jgi:hypothetical protein
MQLMEEIGEFRNGRVHEFSNQLSAVRTLLNGVFYPDRKNIYSPSTFSRAIIQGFSSSVF